MVLGQKGYSGISILPFPSFSLLVPNSCWGYLFLDLNILFAGTVSELIFLWQNQDVEVEKSSCLYSFKFPLKSFP